jgi:hypothetical protein
MISVLGYRRLRKKLREEETPALIPVDDDVNEPSVELDEDELASVHDLVRVLQVGEGLTIPAVMTEPRSSDKLI